MLCLDSLLVKFVVRSILLVNDEFTCVEPRPCPLHLCFSYFICDSRNVFFQEWNAPKPAHLQLLEGALLRDTVSIL